MLNRIEASFTGGLKGPSITLKGHTCEAIGGAISDVAVQLRRGVEHVSVLPRSIVGATRRLIDSIHIVDAKKENSGGGQQAVTPEKLTKAALRAIEKASDLKPGEKVTTSITDGTIYVTKTSSDKDGPAQ